LGFFIDAKRSVNDLIVQNRKYTDLTKKGFKLRHTVSPETPGQETPKGNSELIKCGPFVEQFTDYNPSSSKGFDTMAVSDQQRPLRGGVNMEPVQASSQKEQVDVPQYTCEDTTDFEDDIR
jgi:hypothetical protein